MNNHEKAKLIFKKFEPRLKHLWNKLIKGKYNHATQTAFCVGVVADIESALSEIEGEKMKKESWINIISEMGRKKNEHPLIYNFYHRLIDSDLYNLIEERERR